MLGACLSIRFTGGHRHYKVRVKPCGSALCLRRDVILAPKRLGAVGKRQLEACPHEGCEERQDWGLERGEELPDARGLRCHHGHGDVLAELELGPCPQSASP